MPGGICPHRQGVRLPAAVRLRRIRFMLRSSAAFAAPTPTAAVGYQQLRAMGYSRKTLKAAIDSGHLFHARRDVYLWRGATPRQRSAARIGGRVDCISRLAELGIFVLDETELHVQVAPNASRLRSSADRRTPLVRAPSTHRGRVHWRCTGAAPDDTVTPLVEALAQAFGCQGVRATIASIDSALHTGKLSERDLDLLFQLAPERYRVIRGLIDGRAESGPETYARLIAREFGLPIELQKRIDGVGRVDLVVDGWLVIECDSREFHSTWEAQQEDHRRDMALAARGYARIRVTAHQLFTEPHVLREAIRGLLATRPVA
ncbi:endonuclease domain-containing protein [Microbacterium lacusdiani]